ncbi:hypothetical protein VKT23_016674 [Stygiomarasmius scandens]|uniref:Uncharacterized protein n=1 Tax=Marasmiellus scandens TaxID=2682957 RepID=A0ABR1IWG6_9AGAR
MSTQNANDTEARDVHFPNTEMLPAGIKCSTGSDNPKSVPSDTDSSLLDTSIGKGPQPVSQPPPKTQKRKRGNRGNFHGDRLDYLEKELPGWLRLSRAEKSLWLTEFYSRWFKKFRWHLTDCPAEFAALEPDLPTSTDPNTESTRLPEEDLDALKKKRDRERGEVMKKGKKQLAAWFWRQTSKASQPIAGAEHFAGLIRLLGNVGHAPRRIPLYKFYMTHPDFEDECHRVFQERWSSGGLDRKFRLHFQCQVAEELYNQESEEVKARIEMEAAEHLEEKLSTYKQLMNGEKLTLESLNEFGEMSKEICRQNLVKFLQPLLDTLRLLTDLSFFLVAGAPPAPGAAKDEFTVLTISSGSTVGPDPKKFEEFNRDDFTKNVIGQFLVFLLKTVEDVNTGSNSLDDNGFQRIAERAIESSERHNVPSNVLDDPVAKRRQREGK